MWLFAERVSILACGQKKESTCVCGYSLFVLCAVGHTAQWLILDLTSSVNSSSTGMMSLSRVVVIPLFKRSRKASRSAVESVRDWHIIFRTVSMQSSMRRDFSTRWASSR